MKRFTLTRMNLFVPVLLLAMITSFSFGQARDKKASSVEITFQVDMTYQFEKGTFHPLTDTLDIPGTMNNWTGSPKMTIIPSTHVYQYVYTVDSGTVQEYKFRINGNWATSEFPNGGPNRMYLVPGHADTIINVYDDYQPGTVPVTFKCHMGFQMQLGNFDKEKDYIDIAGNLNNWGAYDVLFDRGNDSVYVINLNIDTSYVVNVIPLEFKFRMNGDWNTSEFPDGGPNRLFRVEDTVDGHKNIVNVWYNDEDPSIPAPPIALNVNLQGNLAVGETLTGTYTYLDVNGDPEGNSHYNWYRADSISQPEAEEITGVMSVNYTLTEADAHKYIAFQVTPVSATGMPPDGSPVRVWTQTFVAGVGIDEALKNPVRFYPNPVGDMMYFDNPGNIDKVEIYNLVGTRMISARVSKTGTVNIYVASLKPGIYFIKLYGQGTGFITSKFVKK